MSHLGSRISALVDGQLSVAATERALAHVALCPPCSAELAAARAAHRALSAAADEMLPTADLTARLLSLAPGPSSDGPQSVLPRDDDPFGAPPSRGRAELRSYGLTGGPATRAWAGRTGAPLRGQVAPRRSHARLVTGSVAGLGAVAAMLFVLGERPEIVPVVNPGSDLETIAGAVQASGFGAVTTGWSPVMASDDGVLGGGTLRRHGWSVPTTMPDGWVLGTARWSGQDDGVLEVDVTSPRGSFVVTEQEGRLDADALAGAPVQVVDGRDVFVLSYEPWHAAWQAGGSVVQVVGSTADDSEVDALVGAFPGGTFDDGVPARVTRGWYTVTGALQHP